MPSRVRESCRLEAIEALLELAYHHLYRDDRIIYQKTSAMTRAPSEMRWPG